MDDTTSTNQLKEVCKVCEESAAGFHFGAYTCEGCKSFFGRMYSKSNECLPECKSGGGCRVTGKQRTACKACRLEKCYQVGMSRSRSRYGRRSHYAKVTRVVEVQQEQRKRQQTSVTPPDYSPPITTLQPFLQLQAMLAANRAIASASLDYLESQRSRSEALDLSKSRGEIKSEQEQPLDLRVKPEAH